MTTINCVTIKFHVEDYYATLKLGVPFLNRHLFLNDNSNVDLVGCPKFK